MVIGAGLIFACESAVCKDDTIIIAHINIAGRQQVETNALEVEFFYLTSDVAE